MGDTILQHEFGSQLNRLISRIRRPPMTSPPLKTLAVFICGPLPDSVEAVYGDNTNVFQKLLTSSLPRPDSAQLSLHPYDVVNKMEYPPEDQIGEYDGIILTGAGACQRTIVLWQAGLPLPLGNGSRFGI